MACGSQLAAAPDSHEAEPESVPGATTLDASSVPSEIGTDAMASPDSSGDGAVEPLLSPCGSGTAVFDTMLCNSMAASANAARATIMQPPFPVNCSAMTAVVIAYKVSCGVADPVTELRTVRLEIEIDTLSIVGAAQTYWLSGAEYALGSKGGDEGGWKPKSSTATSMDMPLTVRLDLTALTPKGTSEYDSLLQYATASFPFEFAWGGAFRIKWTPPAK